MPGLDGTGLLFYRQTPLLERDFSVTVASLPDHAGRMADLIAHLHTTIDRAAPGERVTLVGESFGGALALSFALAHPGRIERLVILNSFPFFAPQARLWLGYHLLRATPWGVMPLVRRLTAWRMHSPHTGTAELERFHALMRQTTRAGYLSRLRMLMTYDVRAQLAGIEVPVLFLASDRDNLVPAVEQATLMSGLAPRASMQVLSGHGHICLIAPDVDLRAIISEWIRGTA